MECIPKSPTFSKVPNIMTEIVDCDKELRDKELNLKREEKAFLTKITGTGTARKYYATPSATVDGVPGEKGLICKGIIIITFIL